MAKATNILEFHRSSHSFRHYFFAQAILILIINSFCLYFLLSRSTLRRRFSSWFMIGLLFSHVLIGSSFIVYYASTNIEGQTLILVVYLYKLREVAFVATFIFLILLSLDRYFDTKRPFYYATLTWRYPVALVMLAVFVIISYYFFISHVKETDSVSSCIIAVSGMVIFSAINITVYNEIKKQANKIVTTVVTNTDQQRMNSLKRIKAQHLISLKISSSITLTFVFFWLPYFIMVVLGSCGILNFRNDVVIILYNISVLFGGFNSITDALLYIFLNKKEFLKELSCSRTTISTNVNREDSSNNSFDYEDRTMDSDDHVSYQSAWI